MNSNGHGLHDKTRIAIQNHSCFYWFISLPCEYNSWLPWTGWPRDSIEAGDAGLPRDICTLITGEAGPRMDSCWAWAGEPGQCDDICDVTGEAGQCDNCDGGRFPWRGLAATTPRDLEDGDDVPPEELDEGEEEVDVPGGGGARGTGKLVCKRKYKSIQVEEK